MDTTMLTPAVTILELPSRLGEIFYYIVLPVLLIAAVGYLLQKRLGLQMATLSRLNFYFVVPAIVYVSLVRNLSGGSDMAGRAILTVLTFAAAALGMQMLLGYLVGRLGKLPPDRRNVLMMTGMFNNSGNYGLPLQRLALGEWGMAMQIFYMVVQNFGNFTLGIVLAAGGRKDRHWRQNLAMTFRFPPLYAITGAVVTVLIGRGLGPDRAAGAAEILRPFWTAIEYVSRSMIPIALLTLGAQLAVVRRGHTAYPVRLGVILRLLVGPVVGLGLIYLLMALANWTGVFLVTPRVAQLMLIASATPTAVNCMLLCLEFDNHPDFAARAVFFSTVLSPLTITLVIFLAQSGWLPGF